MKRIVTILCTMALLVMCLVPMNVMASNGTGWMKVSGEEAWTYSDGQGTDLIVKLRENTLYVQGTGAVPACTRENLGSRPWHGKTIYTIEFADGITSIGAEAFSNMKYLRHVSMPVSTFIEDVSAFAGATEGSFFTFRGMNIVSRNIGNVPYNSLDSIAAFMMKYNGIYEYRVANGYVANWIQNATSMKIKGLVAMDMVTAVQNPAYPLINYTSTLSFVSPVPSAETKAMIANRLQGKTALEIFSIFLGDNTYVTSYNMNVYNENGTVRHTDAPQTYKMTVPAAFINPGRQFTLIQLGVGVVNFLQDEDTDDTTVTFTTDYPSASYALVYKDVVLEAPDVVQE